MAEPATRLPRGWAWLLGPPPQSRQAAVHVASTAADAALAVSLAGSLFFQVSVDAARPAILLYLALTMAPFAVVAPLIGPAIDRLQGGYRMLCLLTCAARALVAMALAGQLQTLLLYPGVLCILVLGKAYSVGKSALVPRLVPERGGLVAANARLSRLSSLAALAAGGASAGILAAAGGAWVVRLAAVLWALAAVLALRIPRPRRVSTARSALEWAELHRPLVVDAATAVAVLRAAVGFLTFLVAFELKRSGTPTWVFGAVLAASGAGSLAGTLVGPVLRSRVSERVMLGVSLAAPLAPLVVGALEPGAVTAALVGASVGLAANVGRQGFDALVQHLAPDADQGRAFAGFETRFQLAWVAGALVPVLARPPLGAAFALLGAVIAVALVLLARRPRSPAPALDQRAEAEALLAAAERLAAARPAEAAALAQVALRLAGADPMLALRAAAGAQAREVEATDQVPSRRRSQIRRSSTSSSER